MIHIHSKISKANIHTVQAYLKQARGIMHHITAFLYSKERIASNTMVIDDQPWYQYIADFNYYDQQIRFFFEWQKRRGIGKTIFAKPFDTKFQISNTSTPDNSLYIISKHDYVWFTSVEPQLLLNSIESFADISNTTIYIMKQLLPFTTREDVEPVFRDFFQKARAVRKVGIDSIRGSGLNTYTYPLDKPSSKPHREPTTSYPKKRDDILQNIMDISHFTIKHTTDDIFITSHVPIIQETRELFKLTPVTYLINGQNVSMNIVHDTVMINSEHNLMWYFNTSDPNPCYSISPSGMVCNQTYQWINASAYTYLQSTNYSSSSK